MFNSIRSIRKRKLAENRKDKTTQTNRPGFALIMSHNRAKEFQSGATTYSPVQSLMSLSTSSKLDVIVMGD